jgi:uncharacterized protein YkwD
VSSEEDPALPRVEAPPRHADRSSALLAVTVLVGAALLGAALFSFVRSDRGVRESSVVLAPVSGLPTGTVSASRLYPRDDPWRAYLADEETCPGGERTDLPLQQQADVMVCLVNWARARRGLVPLAPVPLLSESAVAKANRIVRCRVFAHDACGGPADADARAYGYRGPFGENLYVAENGFGAPRAALDGWLNSPGHRENVFRPQWRSLGIAVEEVRAFGPYRDAELWVSQFGTA